MVLFQPLANKLSKNILIIFFIIILCSGLYLTNKIQFYKEVTEYRLSPPEWEGIGFSFVNEKEELADNIHLINFYEHFCYDHIDINIDISLDKYDSSSTRCFFEITSLDKNLLEFDNCGYKITCNSNQIDLKDWYSEPKVIGEGEGLSKIQLEFYQNELEFGKYRIHIYCCLPPLSSLRNRRGHIDFDGFLGFYDIEANVLLCFPSEYRIYSYKFEKSKIGPKSVGSCISEQIELKNECEYIYILAQRPLDSDILNLTYCAILISLWVGIISILITIIVEYIKQRGRGKETQPKATLSKFSNKFKNN